MQAIELIKQAFEKVAIFDPAEEIAGYDINTGLNIFNEVLAQWSSLKIYIPTTETVTIELMPGVYQYSVSPLIASYSVGNIKDSSGIVSTLIQADQTIANTFQYTNLQARPQYVYITSNYEFEPTDTQVLSSTVTFYPVPDAYYTATLQVAQNIANVGLYDELNNLPPFYYRALKYEIAMELLNSYSEPATPTFQQAYNKIMGQLRAVNSSDNSVRVNNPFFMTNRNIFTSFGLY